VRGADTGRRAALRACALACAGPLAGCEVLRNDAPSFDYHVIRDLRPAVPAAAGTPPRVDRTLLVAAGPTQALFDSDRMVFTRDGAAHSYYQFSNWSQRPARRIQSLAEARLAASGGFGSVAGSLAGIRGDLLLSLRLDELVHDDSAPPGVMRVAVTADLLDWRRRTIVARRSFAQAEPVKSRDARGAARAADEAVTALLDALAPWVESSAASIRP
jgi:cholesterol transport system auxiliary component